jgi:DtxR family Mn-dependent transcriptional regulator
MEIPDKLTASLEDYLKTIARITADKQAARAKDIAGRLNVNMSSVTGALRALADRGLVNYAPYEYVTLTEQGTEVAREVLRRHEGIRDFLVGVLALNEDVADRAACDMEHSISPDVLERIIRLADYIEICPRTGASWIKEFKEYCDNPAREDDCERCLTVCLQDYRERKVHSDEGDATLDRLSPGAKAKIVTVGGDRATRRRMIELGLTPGTLIEVERVAPLGDPMAVKVKGYHLSLRKAEAKTVTVDHLK